MNEESLKDQVN